MKPKYCESNSISYREAADLMRLSHERLIEGGATLRAHQLAGAVWVLTAGYSKAWDTVFVATLADMIGRDDRTTRRAIEECVELGAIQWRPTQWKRGTPSLIGLPDPNTGRELPGHESDTGQDTGHHTGRELPDYLEPRTNGSPEGSPKTYGRREDCVECGKRRPVNGNLVCEACWARVVGTEWVRA